MSGKIVDFLSEVHRAGKYPQRFDKREEKLLECIKAYLDTIVPTPTPLASPTLATAILGAFINYSSVAGAGITNTGSTVIVGDIASSPTATMTGFPPGVISGGSKHQADVLSGQAKVQMVSAQAALAAAGNAVDKSGINQGGTTLAPGVYSYSSSAANSGVLTLDAAGNPAAQFVFQIATTYVTAASSNIVLLNGAKADNVFFNVGTSATLGASSVLNGNILADTAISLGSGAVVNGRLWARTASITMISNTITV